MPRGEGSNAILRAALDAFAKDGYDGASVRNIAAAANVSVSVLYHHFGNKQDLLYTILSSITRDLAQDIEAALDEAKPDPLTRFTAAVRAIASFYAHRPRECNILSREMRSLTRQSRKRHVMEDRRPLQASINSLVADGCKAGIFHVPDEKIASRSIVVLCRDIPTWFPRNGRLTDEEVIDSYVTLSLNMMGVDSKRARTSRSRRPAAVVR